MLHPSRRLVRIAALVLLGAIVVAIVPELRPGFLPASGVFVLAALVDAVLPGWRRTVQVTREVAPSLAVGVDSNATLVLENDSARRCDVEVFDGVPETFEFEGLPHRVDIEPHAGVRVPYTFRPLRRGTATFDEVHLRFRSAFRLWTLRRCVPVESEVRVLPNHRPVLRYHLLAVSHRLEQMGIRRRPRRGMGTSFHQLREYRDGDLPQQIDWKATARRNEVISREYEEERDQRVVLLVDRGRRMAVRDDDVSLLDHALNASLLLTYVALEQGDQVGLVGFSGPLSWMPPVKGQGGMPKILHGLFDWQTTDAPSDYFEAAKRTMVLENRRALVVLLTSLRGEDSAELFRAIEALSRRHLVVVASLKEPAVAELRDTEPADFDDALAVAGAAQYESEREALCANLQQRGVRVLDVLPKDLPAELATAYLDVKHAGAL